MQLSNNWQKLLDNHWQLIQKDNVEVFKNESPVVNKTLSLVLKLNQDLSSEITSKLTQTIPENLKSKIIFQLPEGYHFTLYWSPQNDLTKSNLSQLTQSLKRLFKETLPTTGTINFPHFGKGGLFNIFLTDDQKIIALREQLQQIFTDNGLPIGFRQEYYDLVWGSLTRYSQEFTAEEKVVLKNLPTFEMEKITFTEALLTLNDKFLTPEYTQILGRFLLGTSNDIR